MAAIVLAEDDDDIRAAIVRILRRAGHTVVAAPDGAAGLQAVREHSPDLVVSDIDMPVMSGIELCRAIRADPGNAGLPIVFVSGSVMPGDTRAVDAQVTAVLRKPFTPAELTACLDKVLSAGHRTGQGPVFCP